MKKMMKKMTKITWKIVKIRPSSHGKLKMMAAHREKKEQDFLSGLVDEKFKELSKEITEK